MPLPAPLDNLRVIVLIQLTIAFFSCMGHGFGYNVAAFVIVLWAHFRQGEKDPLAIAMGMLLMSVLVDIVILGVYGEQAFDAPNNKYTGTSKFALGMCILNLIIKPLTGFIAYSEWQTRGEGAGAYSGEYSDPSASYSGYGGAAPSGAAGYQGAGDQSAGYQAGAPEKASF